jgi:hypothetical protein
VQYDAHGVENDLKKPQFRYAQAAVCGLRGLREIFRPLMHPGKRCGIFNMPVKVTDTSNGTDSALD